MSECNRRHGRFFCPTKWQYFNILGDLLAHGRAWQSRDWAYGASSIDELRTHMQRYWAAFAEVLGDFSARACRLTNEFFCASASETLDLWRLDYGFPDPCDPYDTLCEKVRAKGGSTCDYFVEITERRGWKISCRDCQPHEGDNVAAAGLMVADISMPDCSCPPGTLYITVHLHESPAYVDAPASAADLAIADRAILCGPNIDQVKCLIRRLKPVGVEVVYEYDFQTHGDYSDDYGDDYD